MRTYEAHPGVFFPDVGPTLTGIEIEILQHAADGDSTRETAAALHYSPETVKGHWKQIRARLYAKNKTHAVALAMRAGLIE